VARSMSHWLWLSSDWMSNLGTSLGHWLQRISWHHLKNWFSYWIWRPSNTIYFEVIIRPPEKNSFLAGRLSLNPWSPQRGLSPTTICLTHYTLISWSQAIGKYPRYLKLTEFAMVDRSALVAWLLSSKVQLFSIWMCHSTGKKRGLPTN